MVGVVGYIGCESGYVPIMDEGFLSFVGPFRDTSNPPHVKTRATSEHLWTQISLF